MSTETKPTDTHGVLLYYKYVTPQITNLSTLSTFYETNCTSLSLLGRVRISPQGVNVTVGGTLSSLNSHIKSVLEYGDGVFEGTDFKLASCSGDDGKDGKDVVVKECGFNSLSIRVVKELVTLCCSSDDGSLGEKIGVGIESAGKHLSAEEFHKVLESDGGLLKEESPIDFKKVVLLDARNLYETRIGKFETPHVETLDPATRQYSDLPAWIDSNAEKLRGNCVLMYCTGGIRCEMASAYIRSKGAGFENVFQLFGGIQRYLEQFPDGGFFKGKNFVYDHRISVGSSNGYIVGKCLLCGTSFDDYSSRCRCTFCRMLVLVCYSCQKENAKYVCELCHRHRKVAQSTQSVNNDSSENFLTHDTEELSMGSPTHVITKEFKLSCSLGSKKLRILCLHGFRQNASSFKGRTASLAKKLKSLAELVFVNAPHELPFIYLPKQQDGCISTPIQHDPPLPRLCNKKYAWLVAPDFYGKKALDWVKADTSFDPLQYQQQTEGFDESLSYLKSVFSNEGPFDGILGFSQGAAMTALLSARKGKVDLGFDFRFVILCSGFAINLDKCSKGSIYCPSLHVFGNDRGGDRQIKSNTSRDLASCFEDGCRMIVEHSSGHIIPTQSPHIDEVRGFLRRFI